MAGLAKVIGCPHCGRTTAFGLFKGQHLRWCVYCNLSFAVLYNSSSKRKGYRRSRLVKGVLPDNERY